jgi:hypothetical protein
MKPSVLLALFGLFATSAMAQTPLHLQPVAKSDPCIDADSQDLGSCGLEAYGDGNYAAARRAWELAAQHGDYQAAVWLAQIYNEGKGVKRDYARAYAWFDIAAAVHAHAIDTEPAASDPTARDSNQTEIDDRNATAKKLTPAQLAGAQKLSRDWQKASLHSRG